MGGTCERCGGPMVMLLINSMCRDACDRRSTEVVELPVAPILGPPLRGFLRMEMIEGEEWMVFAGDQAVDVPPDATRGMWDRSGRGWAKSMRWKLSELQDRDSLRNGNGIQGFKLRAYR